MLRIAILLIAGLAVAGSASAQDDPAEVDFVLRPAQDADVDDFTGGQPEEEPPAPEEIGPPMARPTGEEPIGPPLAGPTVPIVEEIERQQREDEGDPFAPVGIALGTFVIRPAIEIGADLTDNPSGGTEHEAAVGLVVAPEINIRSEDDRYELEADFRGEAILYGEEEFDEREAEARVRGRYDLTRDTSLDAELGYVYQLDRFTDPDTPDAAIERPPVHDFDAALGVTQRFGRLAVRAAGTLERTINEDVPLAGGGTASRKELDNTEYGARVRTSYEASAALTPFVEGAGGRRDFDQEIDDSGFRRSGTWGELRGGLIFDLGSKLNGEVAVGYRREDIEDDRLDDLNALLVDASIFWSPRRLTEVRFDLSTEARPTSVPDASGSILYSGVLTLARQLTPRFRLEAGVGLDHERFIGEDRTDVTYSGFAGASYAFNRVASLKARYEYERTDSTDPDADTDTHTIGVRLRIQR